VTGKCLTCTTGLFPDSNDPKNCTNCAHPIGPVGAPVTCVSAPFSSTRLIPPYTSTATSVDWRTWGIVAPVQDQGNCGSCWAFSVIANTESTFAIKTGKLFKYSEQHLTSCDTSQGGCNGGWPPYAFTFIAGKGTILGSDYPYTSGTSGVTEPCIAAGLAT
jgi:hypothetical protein